MLLISVGARVFNENSYMEIFIQVDPIGNKTDIETCFHLVDDRGPDFLSILIFLSFFGLFSYFAPLSREIGQGK